LKDLEGALKELTRPDLSTASFAQIRREICSSLVANRALRRKVGLHAVPIDGSPAKGAEAGYFMTTLRDGTMGYLQRRSDDCFQVAVASLLQVPAHLVPDWQLDRQIAAGKEHEQIERDIWGTLQQWWTEQSVTVTFHHTPPTSARRWVGVIETGKDYSDHCLLMSRRDCLFDPSKLLPSRKDEPASEWDPNDISYGVTLT
jgi:hypothetical protein